MASPFDLVSLANLKCWLDVGGTDDDVLPAWLITQISRAILNVIDRSAIVPSSYTEIRDGCNDVSIMLQQWPVIGVSSCVVDGLAIPPSPPIVAGATAQCGYVLDASNAAPPRGHAAVVATTISFQTRSSERHDILYRRLSDNE
jgi:hypothetical protein